MRRNYRNLRVYSKAVDLSIRVCRLSKLVSSKRFQEQLISSAISIPSNIAEGAERDSDKYFRNFLNNASGSCAELHTQLSILAQIESELHQESFELMDTTDEVHRMIRGLMKKLG